MACGSTTCCSDRDDAMDHPELASEGVPFCTAQEVDSLMGIGGREGC